MYLSSDCVQPDSAYQCLSALIQGSQWGQLPRWTSIEGQQGTSTGTGADICMIIWLGVHRIYPIANVGSRVLGFPVSKDLSLQQRRLSFIVPKYHGRC